MSARLCPDPLGYLTPFPQTLAGSTGGDSGTRKGHKGKKGSKGKRREEAEAGKAPCWKCTDNWLIIAIDQLLAALPIIGIGRLVRRYWPIVVHTVGKYKFLFLLPKVNKHEGGFSFW